MTKRKVVLALATGLALTAIAVILATPASAESPVTFSGYLRLRTFALGGFFPADAGVDKASDRYAVSRLRVNVNFKPNDFLEVRWRFHGPHGARFGTTNTSQSGDFSLFSQYFYGVVKTDWGTISAGRVSYDIDSAGLRTLGYSPTFGFSTSYNIFDRDSENDGILYYNEWDNGFGLRAFYVKRAHRIPYTAASGTTPASFYYKDADYDRYSVEPFYKWEGGGASLAIQYDRNNYNGTYAVNVGNFNQVGNVYQEFQKNYVFTVNPAFAQTWQIADDKTFAVHAEAKLAFGKRQAAAAPGQPDPPQIRQDGFGALLDFSLGYPQGNVTLAGWYFRGDDTYQNPGNDPRDPNRARHDLVNGGEGFYPFLLFQYGNNYISGNTRSLEGWQTSGHWGVGLLGNHDINEYVTLNYGIGLFRRTNDFILDDGRDASRSLGTEVDVGLTVKILDGLLWQTKFAFYDAGQYYAERYNRQEFDRTVWGWANEFLFSF